jgi:hypothetical protein
MIIKVLSPTDAQSDSLKKTLIFIEIDIKKLLHVSVWNTIIREHTIGALLKLQFYITKLYFNNCNFSKAQMVCSLMIVFHAETRRSFLMSILSR